MIFFLNITLKKSLNGCLMNVDMIYLVQLQENSQFYMFSAELYTSWKSECYLRERNGKLDYCSKL